MKTIIGYIFGRKRIIIFTFAIFLIYGIYSYITIPKQEMPTIQTPYMLVEVTAPGESATSMSETVIDGIEQNIAAFSNVTSVESTSYNSYSYIEVMFGYDTDDPDLLAEEIFNKISELSLHPSITSMTYSSNYKDPHIIFAVHSETLLENDLELIADNFKNDLLAYDEISGVDIDVPYNEELTITVDKDLLTTYGITLSDVYQIIYANTLNIPLGQFTTAGNMITIEGEDVITSLEDLENLIIIPSNDTLPSDILLSDIASINIVPSTSKAYYYDNDSAVFVSVYFEENIDFTKEGDAVLEIKDTFLEDTNNVDIDEMLFLPDDVESQINGVFESLLIAIGIVLIIVFIGIGIRNSLLIVATIPSIVFGTIAILNISNFQLHKLTIVGLIISIGIMVDNQIVITEGIKKNIDHGIKKSEAAIKAIMDNLGPILSSTLTTIAAFVTLALLPGFLGLVVSSMPITVIITISLSFFVSITLSPVLSTLLLLRTKEKKYKETHEKRIKNMIRFTIKTPLLWIILSILLFAGSTYFAFQNQPVDLYPSDNKSAFYIDYNAGSDVPKDFHDMIIDELNENPHVLNTSSSIGGNIPLFHFSALYIQEQPNYGRIYVNTNFSENEMIDYIATVEKSFDLEVTQEITFHQLKLSPPVAPLEVILSGEDIDTVSDISQTLNDALEDNDIVDTIDVKNNIMAPEILISYDLDAIQSAYLTKAEIDNQLTRAINGYETEMYLGDNTYKTTLKSNFESMDEILLDTIKSDVTNMSYPLSNFISYEIINDYQVIHHYNNQASSVIDLYFSDGSSLSELETLVKDEVATLDTGNITIEYGGENDMFEEILSDLIRASIIAVILIYLIMLVQFNHFLKPLIVFVTIPLSFTGSFLFLLLFNTPITATALVGMVSLIGVTVNTGILLVEYIARSEKTMSLDEACADAVYQRFRPIMLTSATTILGLIPLYITGGNFFSPLAVTFMGGMVTSTIISIFLVPSLYKLFFRKK